MIERFDDQTNSSNKISLEIEVVASKKSKKEGIDFDRPHQLITLLIAKHLGLP